MASALAGPSRQRIASSLRRVTQVPLHRLASTWQLPSDWEAVIGVECHAQLLSTTKLFSPTPPPTLSSPPNTLVNPFDAAHPGTLPSHVQPAALDGALRAALFLNCSIQPESRFDRKHYFYLDLTPGYQITQKWAPLAKDGFLLVRHEDGYLPKGEEEVRVEIEQIQLEQDTAKSTHDPTSSLSFLDVNRSNVGLIEIVSGPQLRSAAQAGAYVRKLQELLRRSGASDGNMEQGSLRCDVNVSIRRRDAREFGTRCEVKNVNGVKFVQKAVLSEVRRQWELLTSSTTSAVRQETRGFDERTGETFFLRSKEDAPDYRYMPDANLPPLVLSRGRVERVRRSLPEHPDRQRERLTGEGWEVPLRDVNVLMRVGMASGEGGEAAAGTEPAGEATRWAFDRPGAAVAYLEAIVAKSKLPPPLVAKWIVHEVLKSLNSAARGSSLPVPPAPEALRDLLELVEAREITTHNARVLLERMVQEANSERGTPSSIRELASSLGFLTSPSSDAAAATTSAPPDDGLRDLCTSVFSSSPDEAAKVRAGKVKVVQRLVGEVMKLSKGKADAKRAREVLLEMCGQAEASA